MILQNNNNKFYFATNDVIYELNQSNNHAKKYSATGKQISMFKIDKNGYVLYKETDDEYLIRKPSGGIVSISDKIDDFIYAFWMGTDDKFYVYALMDNEIYRVELNESDISVIKIATDIDFSFYIYNEYFFKQELNDAVLFIHKSNPADCFVFDEISQEVEILQSSLPNYENIINVSSSSEYFYIATDNNLYKFDLNLDYIQLLDEGKYKIHTMCADLDNNVIFSALQYPENKFVVGIVDSENNIKIIDTEIGERIMFLEFL